MVWALAPRHTDCKALLVSNLAAKQAMLVGKRPYSLLSRLPSEHGFWVMLGAAQASALLRSHGALPSLFAAVLVVGAVIFAGSSSHRRIRKSSAAQLVATATLALSSVPVELAGGLSFASIAPAALARVVVFVTSALVVRAAFAGAGHAGQRWFPLLLVASVALPALSAALLFALGRTAEAGTCVIAAGVCAVFAWSRPSVKQLKPLGITLAGLALITVITLSL